MAIRDIRLFGDPILLTEAGPDGPRHQEAGLAGDPGGIVERPRAGHHPAGPRLPAPPGRPRALTG